ncbi:MAG: DUF2807 domain-containing protein [Planctomycetes bacterium]|nr:DUF2807 domain-containing protein [Planctomycetota bacterium]
MRLPTSALSTLALAFAAAACGGPIQGSGTVAKKTLPAVGEFHVVRVDGVSPMDVTVTSGGEPSVVIEADDNLLDEIRADVDDGRLRVWTRSTWKSMNSCRVTITVKSIAEASVAGAVNATVDLLRGDVAKLDADGASNLTVSKVDAKSVKVGASGKCNITFGGKFESVTARARFFSTVTANAECPDANLIAEGASHINGIVTKRAVAMTTGVSEILLDCSEHLQATALAQSKILYGGDPKVEGEIGDRSFVEKRPAR